MKLKSLFYDQSFDFCKKIFSIFAPALKTIRNQGKVNMEKPKVLFVTQEITPYLKESHMGYIGRHLPQGIQERGKEIRTFMPRFGNINERSIIKNAGKKRKLYCYRP